jgi:hypothetical protein
MPNISSFRMGPSTVSSAAETTCSWRMSPLRFERRAACCEQTGGWRARSSADPSRTRGPRSRRRCSTGRRRRTRIPANRDLLKMELAGVLSNPEVGPKLDRLAEVLGSIEPKLASHRIVLRKLPLAQGRILRTIKQVLAGYPGGLQTFEIRRMVEQELGQRLPKSTVKDALASNPAFERLGYGRYRLAGRAWNPHIPF